MTTAYSAASKRLRLLPGRWRTCGKGICGPGTCGADRQNAGTLRRPAGKTGMAHPGGHRPLRPAHGAAPTKLRCTTTLKMALDERLDYQTLAEAEQAAQQYVAEQWRARTALPIDGAGIYD